MYTLDSVLYTFYTLEKIVTELISITKPLMSNDTILSGVISAIGSLFGGLIGAIMAAIVAFKVAKKQIEAEKIKEINNLRIKWRNYLILLLHEIKHNKIVFEEVKKSSNFQYYEILDFKVWEKIRFEANSFLSIKEYDILEDMYRLIKELKDGCIKKSIQEVDTYIDVLNKAMNEIKKVLEKNEEYLIEQGYIEPNEHDKNM